MLSPSEIIRPTDLSERLATRGAAEAPTLPEPTPTIMAERFAPEAQRIAAEGPARTLFESQPIPGLMAERRSVSSPGKWFLVIAILVSLVPTVVILALLWQGVITIPQSSETKEIVDRVPSGAIEQAAMAPAPIMQVASKPQIPAPEIATPEAVKPEIALKAPGHIEAKSGDEIAFAVGIDSPEALPSRSIIAIRAMPEGATFSQGRPYGAAEWDLTPDEIGNLTLRLPKTARGSSDMRIELMSADGEILASADTRLDIAPDPKAALVLRSDEAGRIADLIAHGLKMVDVGYLAGARAYFERAAEAGSGDAALLLSATFDPEFIQKIGAQGIKPDPQQARNWYERAKELGVEDPETKLKALEQDATGHQHPIQSTEVQTPTPAAPAPATAAPAALVPAAPAPAAAAPAAEQTAPATVETKPDVAVAEAQPSAAVETSLPTGSDEWVALTNYANVRSAPSSTADTIRVAEKGAKLRVTGRQGNWVQVTDPTTSEVGWVYARFIETTPER
jgi:cytoskeletal protein RodZ